MKKISSTIIVAALLAVSAAVIGFGASASGNKGAQDGEQRYAWPLATSSTEDTITHVFATTFAEEVGRLSDGKMKIQVYPQSTLGGDRELLESCKDGDIPFVLQSPAPQVSFMPQLCVFDMPCLFQDIQTARDTVDNPEFQEIIKGIYEDAGYQLLGTADQCFRVMTSQKPFTGFDSFKGQKIRTMENPFHIQFWKALGANPTPMTFSEVYIGLQQGTIDAQENAYELLVSAKLYEQQKYVIDTNAVPDYTTLIVSDEFYQGLSEKQKDIIHNAAQNAQAKARQSADDRRERRKKELQKEGMEIIELDDAVWKEMQDACKPVYESIRERAGDELVDLYMGK
ncbi:MAG: TRAP transporter substrate-binding protein [Ruminococcus sp.]|jgi:tripartite ATP-independent transporter DctP family solute receptor|nr:TRAP transporter substrate-binding protein [Ruminococcus sp.]